MFTHFSYISGSNPYIAFTDNEAKRIIRKYSGKKAKKNGITIKQIKPGFYLIDDHSREE